METNKSFIVTNMNVNKLGSHLCNFLNSVNYFFRGRHSGLCSPDALPDAILI